MDKTENRNAEKSDLSHCFQNRELSWLMFNRRVLEQANYQPMQLLERLKFISIFTTNLDEFYMVRVGSLSDSAMFSPDSRENKTGFTPQEQLVEINKSVLPLYELRRQYFAHAMTQLEEFGVRHHALEDLDKESIKELKEIFQEGVMPLLSPQIIDNRHPFPHIANKHIHVAVSLEKKNKSLYGIIAVPQNLDRVIPFGEKRAGYVLIEELICFFADMVFEQYSVVERTVLAITRNADISTEAELLDEDIDFRKHMSKIIRDRRRMAPVRLELKSKVSGPFEEFICNKIAIQTKHIYIAQTPLDFTFVFELGNLFQIKDKKKMNWPPFVPREKESFDRKTDMIKQIQKKDMLLSLPYESMTPFLTLIHQAAADSAVASIKITLYRLARHSKLAEYLILAAENGKEVVVLMELRARFDEKNNIEWAERLEEAGCRVIYGPAMFKTHSKICLITRREFGKISYITQVGTGNYNEATAKLYTDLSLITSNQQIGHDAALFFNNMLLGNLDGVYSHLWASPLKLKERFIESVEKEAEKSRRGEEGRIIVKCNSLTDKDIILKLIEASRQGVKITLIVRGICCLIPKITGYTDNIRIISVVGQFLEHSRIFCFGTGEQMKLYISSADLMTRNTERRVEIGCPIYDEGLKSRAYKILEYMAADNTKAWELASDGFYNLRTPGLNPEINAQEHQLSPSWDDDLPKDTVTDKKSFFSKIFARIKSKSKTKSR